MLLLGVYIPKAVICCRMSNLENTLVCTGGKYSSIVENWKKKKKREVKVYLWERLVMFYHSFNDPMWNSLDRFWVVWQQQRASTAQSHGSGLGDDKRI